MQILSAAQVRDWDNYTIKNKPISSWALMERASRTCTDWLVKQDKIIKPLKIFCGKGNNGGDGLAIACQLAEKGIQAQVYVLELGAEGSDDFNINLHRLHEHKIQFVHLQDEAEFPEILQGDLIIDALFGTGLNRPLQGLAARLIHHINNSNAEVISVDIPSGMFADQSTIPNPIIKADYTLTFQCLKLCFLLPENEAFFNHLIILPIGLLPDFLKETETPFYLVEASFVKKIYKPRKNFSHKGTFGHALIIAGEEGKMGAAILTTKACLRSGAGLVTTVADKKLVPILQVAVPEAMATVRKKELEYYKYSSVGIGPGLGTGKETKKLVKEVLELATNLVIDADALNIISEDKELLKKIPAGSILTPHPKEFERLFGKSENDYVRLQTAIEKSSDYNIYVILKGHRTAIVCPGGEVFFNATGNPGMATAGSGDVLTGIITGLLAQKYTPFEAAVLGVYLHGLSGDFAANALSQEALIAGDLISFLPDAFKTFL